MADFISVLIAFVAVSLSWANLALDGRRRHRAAIHESLELAVGFASSPNLARRFRHHARSMAREYLDTVETPPVKHSPVAVALSFSVALIIAAVGRAATSGLFGDGIQVSLLFGATGGALAIAVLEAGATVRRRQRRALPGASPQ